MKEIRAKVAEVLTERELVINAGSVEGVEVGQTFKILNALGSEIRDPDTRKVIGSVELVKVIVKIVSVNEHVAVGRTFRTITEPSSGAARISDLFVESVFKQGGTRVETLRTDEGMRHKEMSAEESYIKRGDPAVLLSKTELATD